MPSNLEPEKVAPQPPPETARRRRVLIVDDEPGIRESLRLTLRDDYDLLLAESGEEALRAAQSSRPDVVLLDIVMPGMDGLAALERLKAFDPCLPVIMVTATRTIKTAVTAIKLGAYDYIQKPFEIEDLRIILNNATRSAALEREVEELRAEVGRRYQLGNIIGRSEPMQEIFKTVAMVAPLKTTVLITGESGTGKDLIARAIHYQSPRSGRPMTLINCAAIPATLLESELFGHEKGSFTGADSRKLGQFELANQSTIFLDEIGEMQPAIQAKLLRVIETGEFMRVGGTKSISVDVRIIAATNRDMESAIRDGSFRPDLYYRLNVVSLHLPPLRERREDLPLLIKHFSATKAAELGIAERSFAGETIDLMMRYRWPGNVRELENLIERLLVLSDFGPVKPEELPEALRRGPVRAENTREQVLQGVKSLPDAVDDFERDIIQGALEQVDFNQTRAAELLGTTRRILKYRMDKLGISDSR
ncbi:MAG TPA: sigma-54 dependent transcriptional regulator [Candidatus Bathyarchaeia archaeon]|nr:sigma-54 dependent transcriptional regulator [Candidatus Bathyarchaeia archaeon]